MAKKKIKKKCQKLTSDLGHKAEYPKELKDIALNFLVNIERYQILHVEPIGETSFTATKLIALIAKPKIKKGKLTAIYFKVLSDGNTLSYLHDIEILIDKENYPDYDFIIKADIRDKKDSQPKNPVLEITENIEYFEIDEYEWFDIIFKLKSKEYQIMNPTLGKLCTGTPYYSR